MVVHARNPSFWEVEAEGSKVQGYAPIPPPHPTPTPPLHNKLDAILELQETLDCRGPMTALCQIAKASTQPKEQKAHSVGTGFGSVPGTRQVSRAGCHWEPLSKITSQVWQLATSE